MSPQCQLSCFPLMDNKSNRHVDVGDAGSSSDAELHTSSSYGRDSFTSDYIYPNCFLLQGLTATLGAEDICTHARAHAHKYTHSVPCQWLVDYLIKLIPSQ